jgi:protein gp37
VAESTIEWLQGSGSLPEAWNPTTGCDIKSRGCKNCYAMTMARRLKAMGQPAYQRDGDPRTSGPGFGLTLHPDRLGQPSRWRKPRVVFVDSMSDLFHEQVPDEFVWRVWAAMAGAPRHTFLILTKRPKRMRELVNSWHRGVDARGQRFVAWPLPNVWLGVSVENRGTAWRADQLRETLAERRFVSAEPLLGPLDGLNLAGIDWLIAGGESGPRADPMDPKWARDLRDRCLDSICPLCAGAVTVGAWHCPRCAGSGRETLFFFKQWGAWGPLHPGRRGRTHVFLDAPPPAASELRTVYRTSKKHQGRVLDRQVWSERPPLAHEVVDRLATRPRSTPEQGEVDLQLERRQP